MSAEDLDNYETDAELALYKEYRDVIKLFTYVVEPNVGSIWRTRSISTSVPPVRTSFRRAADGRMGMGRVPSEPLRQERAHLDVQGCERRGSAENGYRHTGRHGLIQASRRFGGRDFYSWNPREERAVAGSYMGKGCRFGYGSDVPPVALVECA